MFVDIDGVLDLGDDRCPDGLIERWLVPDDPQPVQVNPVPGQWLHELAAHSDMAWGQFVDPTRPAQAVVRDAEDRALLATVHDSQGSSLRSIARDPNSTR